MPEGLVFVKLLIPWRSLLNRSIIGMADRVRRGMLIKNNGSEAVDVAMASRTLRIEPGEETFITPEEVRDPTLREALQERSISIVRPATEAEDEALQERIGSDDK